MPKTKKAIIARAKKEGCSKSEIAARIRQSVESTKNTKSPVRVSYRSKSRRRRRDAQGVQRAPVSVGRTIRAETQDVVRLRRKNVLFSNMVSNAVANTVEFTEFDISPVNATLFSWMNPIAGCFEEYKINKFVIRHEPLVPTSTSGYIAIAFSYNAQDVIPPDEATFFMYKTAVRNSIWQQCQSQLSSSKWLFTEPNVLPAEYDIKSFQSGKLFLACLTSLTSTVCGQLFYDLDIEYRKPRKSQYTPSASSEGRASTNDLLSSRAPFTTDGDSFGNSSLERINGWEYKLKTPGKYVIPTTVSMQDDVGAATVFRPSAATTKSQLKDLACGFINSAGTFVVDNTFGTVSLGSEPDVTSWVDAANASTAVMAWDWIVETLKPNAVFSTAVKANGGTPDYFNSSSGWGTLWDLAASATDIAVKAAPYLLTAASLFLLEEDIEYERLRKLGYFSEFHGGGIKSEDCYNVCSQAMKYYRFPSDGKIFHNISPRDCRAIALKLGLEPRQTRFKLSLLKDFPKKETIKLLLNEEECDYIPFTGLNICKKCGLSSEKH